jgi:hypothetical protein
MRRLSPARTLALAAVALGLAGCNSGTTVPGQESVVGTYSLVSVDGKPMPSPFYQDPTYGIESAYVSGTMNLKADGTWERAFVIHYNRDHRADVPFDRHYTGSGTYTVSGNAIHFTGTENVTGSAPTPVPPVDAAIQGQAVVVHLTTSPGARFVRN